MVYQYTVHTLPRTESLHRYVWVVSTRVPTLHLIAGLRYAIVLYGKLVMSVIYYVLLRHHNNWLIGLINLVA